MNRFSPRTLSWIAVVTIFVVDFVTKRWVLASQSRLLEGIDVIDGIIGFTYVRNPGAAFGMLPNARWILTVVSILAVVGLSWLVSRRSTHGLKRLASTLILAGAAGNLVDRLFYEGLVVDFLEFRFFEFPVFNVADMGVSIGAVVLVLSLLLEREPEPEPAPPEELVPGEADGPAE
jgi:signal peptidase II